MLRQRLTTDARISVQCTSPLVAPKSYWCIVGTMESAGFHVRPYHAPVPSFGEWGFVLASTGPIPTEMQLPPEVSASLRYLSDEIANNLFDLPPDLKRIPADINQLNNQALVHYYDQEWGSWR